MLSMEILEERGEGYDESEVGMTGRGVDRRGEEEKKER